MSEGKKLTAEEAAEKMKTSTKCDVIREYTEVIYQKENIAEVESMITEVSSPRTLRTRNEEEEVVKITDAGKYNEKGNVTQSDPTIGYTRSVRRENIKDQRTIKKEIAARRRAAEQGIDSPSKD